ncbi:MAG: hypothetical protein P1P84_17740 [Deferrisomatales bacterium]|nr:hypothetical protein [Deferrisomatales bacterium]
MADGSVPIAEGGVSSGLLSAEEIQELLAPLDVEATPALQPVLVLTKHPREAERVILHLMHHAVPVVPTEKWEDALGLLENRRYAGVVATAAALGPDPAHAVEYLRTFHPGLALCVIVDPAHQRHSIAASVVERSEMEAGLDRFLAQLGGDPEPTVGSAPPKTAAFTPPPRQGQRLRLMENVTRSEPSRKDPIRPQPETGAPQGESVAPGVTFPPAGASGPDPLLAVQALLEAKASGEDLVAGLRRWAERDPAILGVAECHLDEAEWRLRATTPIVGERHRMLLLLLDHLGSPSAVPEEPATAGPFSLIPLFRSPRSCVALWHQDATAGSELLRRLRPLLPLIQALPEKREDETEAAVRERFIALLESRMRATDRGEGHLGMLLVEAPEGESPALLCRDLQSALRGGDWIEVVGTRLYVILDHPGKGTLAAIGARLRKLPASDSLQVVALSWDPSQGRAAALVRTAERLLEQGEVVVLGTQDPG